MSCEWKDPSLKFSILILIHNIWHNYSHTRAFPQNSSLSPSCVLASWRLEMNMQEKSKCNSYLSISRWWFLWFPFHVSFLSSSCLFCLCSLILFLTSSSDSSSLPLCLPFLLFLFSFAILWMSSSESPLLFRWLSIFLFPFSLTTSLVSSSDSSLLSPRLSFLFVFPSFSLLLFFFLSFFFFFDFSKLAWSICFNCFIFTGLWSSSFLFSSSFFLMRNSGSSRTLAAKSFTELAPVSFMKDAPGAVESLVRIISIICVNLTNHSLSAPFSHLFSVSLLNSMFFYPMCTKNNKFSKIYLTWKKKWETWTIGTLVSGMSWMSSPSLSPAPGFWKSL